MSDNYASAAERVIARIVIYPDPDEPMSYEDGIFIGCNAKRVLGEMRRAGFAIFKTAKRARVERRIGE
jgi:hypothetical protein